MRSKRAQRTLTTVAAGLVVLGLAGLLGFVGCGGADKNMTTPAGEGAPWVTATTAAPMNTATRGQADYDGGGGTAARQYSSTETPERAWSGAVTASVVSGQKIISDAQLEIEVERGRFETVLDQAILLADRYGGYLVSSTSYAGGEDDAMRERHRGHPGAQRVLHPGSERRRQAGYAQGPVALHPGCYGGGT